MKLSIVTINRNNAAERPFSKSSPARTSFSIGKPWTLLWRSVAVLLTAITMGVTFLTLVYTLPVAPMREHARQAIPLFQREGAKPSWSCDLRQTDQFARLDNYSDIIWTGTATAFRYGSAFRDAMANEHPEGEGNGDAVVSWFASTLDDNMRPTSARTPYARYWHGYLLLLKPLLIVLPIQQIRIVNAALVLFVFCLAAISAMRRFGVTGLLAFFPAVFVLNPVSACLSLQYTSAFTITMISFSIVCFRSEWLSKDGRVHLLFLAIGIATSFFDMLTFPLATCGLPLAAAVLAERPENWRRLLSFVPMPVFWGGGYAAMWAAKWLLASLATGANVVSDAVGQAAFRMSGAIKVGEVSGMRALTENWHVVCNTPVPLFALLALAAIGVTLALNRRKSERPRCWPCVFLLLAISALPLIWMLVLRNHSIIHPFMASKTFSITVFAFLCIPIALFQSNDDFPRASPPVS